MPAGSPRAGCPRSATSATTRRRRRAGSRSRCSAESSNVSPDSQWNSPADQPARRAHRRAPAAVLGTHPRPRRTPHVPGEPRGRAGASPTRGARLAPIGPSPLRETLHRAFAREMDEHDVARVVADYARAAARCREGGLDGIETLAGAHLIGQFLSPATNRRTDRFGGSVENRCRFGLMVHEAIREAVGEDFVVGIRFGGRRSRRGPPRLRGMPPDRRDLRGVGDHRLLQRNLRADGHPDQARDGTACRAWRHRWRRFSPGPAPSGRRWASRSSTPPASPSSPPHGTRSARGCSIWSR